MGTTIVRRLRRNNGTDFDIVHLETEKSCITDFPESLPPTPHSHAASDITSGAIPVVRGGTGATEYTAALQNLHAAAENHTHSEYAPVNHTHSQYAPISHQHDWNNDIFNKPTSMPASDVWPWAKQQNKPTYTYNEVGAAPGDYGWGTVHGKTITNYDAGPHTDLNECTGTGVYQWWVEPTQQISHAPANAPYDGNGFMLVVSGLGGWFHQTVYTWNGTLYTRVGIVGPELNWSEWRCVRNSDWTVPVECSGTGVTSVDQLRARYIRTEAADGSPHHWGTFEAFMRYETNTGRMYLRCYDSNTGGLLETATHYADAAWHAIQAHHTYGPDLTNYYLRNIGIYPSTGADVSSLGTGGVCLLYD